MYLANTWESNPPQNKTATVLLITSDIFTMKGHLAEHRIGEGDVSLRSEQTTLCRGGVPFTVAVFKSVT